MDHSPYRDPSIVVRGTPRTWLKTLYLKGLVLVRGSWKRRFRRCPECREGTAKRFTGPAKLFEFLSFTNYSCGHSCMHPFMDLAGGAIVKAIDRMVQSSPQERDETWKQWNQSTTDLRSAGPAPSSAEVVEPSPTPDRLVETWGPPPSKE